MPPAMAPTCHTDFARLHRLCFPVSFCPQVTMEAATAETGRRKPNLSDTRARIRGFTMTKSLELLPMADSFNCHLTAALLSSSLSCDVLCTGAAEMWRPRSFRSLPLPAPLPPSPPEVTISTGLESRLNPLYPQSNRVENDQEMGPCRRFLIRVSLVCTQARLSMAVSVGPPLPPFTMPVPYVSYSATYLLYLECEYYASFTDLHCTPVAPVLLRLGPSEAFRRNRAPDGVDPLHVRDPRFVDKDWSIKRGLMHTPRKPGCAIGLNTIEARRRRLGRQRHAPIASLRAPSPPATSSSPAAAVWRRGTHYTPLSAMIRLHAVAIVPLLAGAAALWLGGSVSLASPRLVVVVISSIFRQLIDSCVFLLSWSAVSSAAAGLIHLWWMPCTTVHSLYHLLCVPTSGMAILVVGAFRQYFHELAQCVDLVRDYVERQMLLAAPEDRTPAGAHSSATATVVMFFCSIAQRVCRRVLLRLESLESWLGARLWRQTVSAGNTYAVCAEHSSKAYFFAVVDAYVRNTLDSFQTVVGMFGPAGGLVIPSVLAVLAMVASTATAVSNSTPAALSAFLGALMVHFTLWLYVKAPSGVNGGNHSQSVIWTINLQRRWRLRQALWLVSLSGARFSSSYLQKHLDPGTDGCHRASALRRLHSSHVVCSGSLNETDLFQQHDALQHAIRELQSLGGTKPDDLVLIATLEKALPPCFGAVVQAAQKANLTSLDLYNNMLLQHTRIEVNKRAIKKLEELSTAVHTAVASSSESEREYLQSALRILDLIGATIDPTPSSPESSGFRFIKSMRTEQVGGGKRPSGGSRPRGGKRASFGATNALVLTQAQVNEFLEALPVEVLDARCHNGSTSVGKWIDVRSGSTSSAPKLEKPKQKKRGKKTLTGRTGSRGRDTDKSRWRRAAFVTNELDASIESGGSIVETTMATKEEEAQGSVCNTITAASPPKKDAGRSKMKEVGGGAVEEAASLRETAVKRLLSICRAGRTVQQLKKESPEDGGGEGGGGDGGGGDGGCADGGGDGGGGEGGSSALGGAVASWLVQVGRLAELQQKSIESYERRHPDDKAGAMAAASAALLEELQQRPQSLVGARIAVTGYGDTDDQMNYHDAIYWGRVLAAEVPLPGAPKSDHPLFLVQYDVRQLTSSKDVQFNVPHLSTNRKGQQVFVENEQWYNFWKELKTYQQIVVDTEQLPGGRHHRVARQPLPSGPLSALKAERRAPSVAGNRSSKAGTRRTEKREGKYHTPDDYYGDVREIGSATDSEPDSEEEFAESEDDEYYGSSRARREQRGGGVVQTATSFPRML